MVQAEERGMGGWPRSTRVSISLALAFGVLLAAVAWRVFGPVETVDARARRLADEADLVIGYGPPDSFYVHPYEPSAAAAEGLWAKPAEAALVMPALDGIEAALAVYPTGFVTKLIDAIFIAGELRMDGAAAGGVVVHDWIVLTAASELGPRGVRETAEYSVHHELSTFVLRHKPANSMRWATFAPFATAFVHRADGALARDEPLGPEPKTGFLSAYGATNPENDFNVYAERVFMRPKALVQLAKVHDVVARKLRFLLQTYIEVDARMADVFRASGFGPVLDGEGPAQEIDSAESRSSR